jgi:hypothetical protein
MNTTLAERRTRVRHRIALYETINLRQNQIHRIGRAIRDSEADPGVSASRRNVLLKYLAALRHDVLLAQIRFDADDLIA